MGWFGSSAWPRRPRPSRSLVAGLALLVGAELLLAGIYVATRSVTIRNPLVLAYPFVWIDVSLLALYGAESHAGSASQRLAGLVVAGGYLLVLCYVGGVVGRGTELHTLYVDWNLPPGYGPAVVYDGATVRVLLEPYKVVGYLTLSFLIYATLLDTTRAAVSGVVGLFSCVSCTWPILGTALAAIFGGSSAVAAFALSRSYGLGTLVFLSAVALLYYGPRLSNRRFSLG